MSHHPQLIKLIAVAAGTLGTTVRSPLNATGFTHARARAGFIGLDALGTGAGAAYRDDLLLVGLAPHVSAGGGVDNPDFHVLLRLSDGSSQTSRFPFAA